ncbi:unnamed protein product [Bursaphelenchus xylophilus]|uniref:(pine wood nematode) hypothetical protein n=1 Tax=Bursaphelenchus xylophilus TaxID=6326 RepID=A0A1I7SL91_BURXY|nr:unnamed protein product [Bursaphelenchus xylophilus]CAG9129421.1 unnamed protein product [Bursaphelenchus xylophilus]
MNVNGGFSKSNEPPSIRRCHELNCPSTHCHHNSNEARPRIISAPSSPIPQRPVIYLDQISRGKSFTRKETQLSSNGEGFEWMELPKSPRGMKSPGHTPMRFPKGKENDPALEDRIDFDATQTIEPDRDLTPTLPTTPMGTLKPSGFFSSPPELQKSDLLAEVCKSLERTQDTLRKCRTPVMEEGRSQYDFRHEKPNDERKRDNTSPVKASRTLRFDPNPQIRMRTSSDVSSEEWGAQGSSKDHGEYKKTDKITSPRDVRALSRKQGPGILMNQSRSPGSNFESSLRSRSHGEDPNHPLDPLLDASGEVYDSLVMRKQESIENDRSQSEILVEREDTIPSREEFDQSQGRSDVISPYRQILLRNRELFERIKPRKLDFEGNTSVNERNNGKNAKFKQIPIRPKDIMDRRIMNPTRLEGPPSHRTMAAPTHFHVHQHFEANFSSAKPTSKDTVTPKQQYLRILKNIYSHKVDLLIQEEKEAQIRQDRKMELMVIQKKKNVVKELAERIQQFKADCKHKRFSEAQIERMISKEQSNLDEMESKVEGLLEAARKRNEILMMKKGHKGEYSNYSQYSSLESTKKPPHKLDAGTSPHLPGQVSDRFEKEKFKFEPKKSSSSTIFEANIREKGDKIGSAEPPDSSRSTQYDITSIETDPSTPIQKSPIDHGEDGEKTPILAETSEKELRAFSEEDRTDDLFHTPKKNRGFGGFQIPKLNLDFLDDGSGIDDTMKALGMEKQKEAEKGTQDVLEELENQQTEPDSSQNQQQESEVTQVEYSERQERPSSVLGNDNTLDSTFKRAMEESFLGGIGIDFRLGEPGKGAPTIVQEKDISGKKDHEDVEKIEEEKEYEGGRKMGSSLEPEVAIEMSNEAITDAVREVTPSGKIEEKEDDLGVKTAELLDKKEDQGTIERAEVIEAGLEDTETKKSQGKMGQHQEVDDESEKRQDAQEVPVEEEEAQETTASEDVNQLSTAIQDFHLETFEKQHGKSEEKEEFEENAQEKIEEPVQSDSPSVFSSLRSDLPISEDLGLESPKIDGEIDEGVEQKDKMGGEVEEELASPQREPTESSEEPKSQPESAESRGRSSDSNGSHRRRRSLIPQLQRLDSGSTVLPTTSVGSPDPQPSHKSKIPRRRSSVGSELPESTINEPTTASSTQSSIPEQLETAKSSSSESTAKGSTSSSEQPSRQSTQRTSTDSGDPSGGQGGSKGSSARSGQGTMNSGSDSIPEDVTTARDSDSPHSTSLTVPTPPSGQSDSAISSLSTPRIFSLSHPNAMRSPKERTLTVWPKAQRSTDNNSLLSASINSSRANDSLLHTGEVNPRRNGLADIVEMNSFSHLDYVDKMQSWHTNERVDALIEYFTIRFYQKHVYKYRKRLLNLEKIENFREVQVDDEFLEKEVPEEDMLEVVLIVADHVAYFMNQAVKNQMIPSERTKELYDAFRGPNDENMVKFIKKKMRLLTEIYPQPCLRSKWELTSIERKVDYIPAEERFQNNFINGKIAERVLKPPIPYP